MPRSAMVLVLCSLLATVSACTTMRDPSRAAGFVSRQVTVDGVTRTYQVFVPSQNAGGEHPAVVLFLHGSGERGDDGAAPTTAGLGPHVRAHADTFPAIVVFPQVPEDEEWAGANAKVAFAALDAATREFGGDVARTYLTGMSMGGYGTWELALAQPTRFAALVPVCGAVKRLRDERALFVTQVANEPDPYTAIATRLRDVPVWIFHGAQDDDVPPGDDRRLIAVLRANGARDARYTEFPDLGHNAWDATYADAAMWDWLWTQSR